MPAGRCPGCGESGPDYRVILTHTSSCPQFAVLYREHPRQALDPRAEHERYRAAAARGEEKDAALADRVAHTGAARTAMSERFRTRDLLED